MSENELKLDSSLMFLLSLARGLKERGFKPCIAVEKSFAYLAYTFSVRAVIDPVSTSLEVSDTFFGENGTITFNLDEDGFVCNARTVEEFMRLQAYDVFRQIERKTGANLCEGELDSLRRKSLSDAGIPDPVKLRHTSQVFINKQENF